MSTFTVYEYAILKPFEPRHEIYNDVAFWHVKTQTSLCSLILSLETQNGVRLLA